MTILVGTAAMLAGCGGEQLATVEGRILVDGQPAGPGRVIFMPDESQGNRGRAAVADFAADGRFRLKTGRDGDGAVVGEHRVIVQARSPGEEETVVTSSVIPARYWNAAQPSLTATVESGDNYIELRLESEPSGI